MAVKVEMMVTVCINGRPIWRKAKTMRGEMTYQMTDKEYGRVVDAGIQQLGREVKDARDRDAKNKEAVVAK